MSKVKRSVFLTQEVDTEFQIKCLRDGTKAPAQLAHLINVYTFPEKYGKTKDEKPVITQKTIRNKIRKGFKDHGIDLDKVILETTTEGKPTPTYADILGPLFDYIDGKARLQKGEK